MKNFCFLAAGAIWLTALPAHAIDGASVTLGTEDDVDMARIGFQWNWQKTWFSTSNWRLGGYWDVSLGYWDAHNPGGGSQNITDLGITPVFRLQRNNTSGFVPYLEGAIGFHLLSRAYTGRLGSRFEFGDHFGAGVRFGTNQEYDFAYQFMHLSNGGIKQPNHGVNLNQIRFAYQF
jgi:hypothetical protein